MNREIKFRAWDTFTKEMQRVEYNDLFGEQEIARDLIVVGKGFWLERHGYEGEEWWEFRTMPIKPNESRDCTRVNSGAWGNLSEINEVKICDRCNNTFDECECEYELMTDIIKGISRRER